jgi:hypothetical protein
LIVMLKYYYLHRHKKSPPKNRTASNDCLPYENLK